MPRDTRAPAVSDSVAPTIVLREDRFELVMRAVGIGSNKTKRAAFLGIDRRTLNRVLSGEVRVSEEFMAKTISAVRRHGKTLKACGLSPTLDELFEVVDVVVNDERAAA